MIINQDNSKKMSASFTLAAFIIVSLVIHVIGLLASNSNQSMNMGSDNISHISASLKGQSQAQKQLTKSPQSLPANVTKPQTKSVTKNQLVDSPQPVIELSSIQKQKIIGQIKQNLARHFYYPPQAQRRGLEGEVILAFLLSTEGKINTITISRSSGFSILDNAALNALSQASRDFLASKPTLPTSLTIPVIFKLSGG